LRIRRLCAYTADPRMPRIDECNARK
jgi:hypothetical protein